MEAKYVQAIKAGIIGGVILAVCMLVNLFIDIINVNSYTYVPGVNTGLMGLGLLGCCVFLVEIVVLVGTGALAAMMAKSLIVKIEEAFIVGAIAGVVAGLIGTVIQVVDAVVRPWLENTSSYLNYYNYYSYDYGMPSSVISMLTGVVGAVICCGPMLIIVGAILAGIGGAIYAAAVLKIK